MKTLFIALLMLTSLSTFAEEINPPAGIVTNKSLSAEGWYETRYQVTAAKAFKNEDGTVTLHIPFFIVNGYERYLKGRISGNKICDVLNLGHATDKKTEKIVGGAGSPWAFFAEGRDLECFGCHVRVISELTCKPKK
ncbi:MAG: hypothetical protein ACOYL6_15395 [Bacteriovoracaceae bacterium]